MDIKHACSPNHYEFELRYIFQQLKHWTCHFAITMALVLTKLTVFLFSFEYLTINMKLEVPYIFFYQDNNNKSLISAWMCFILLWTCVLEIGSVLRSQKCFVFFFPKWFYKWICIPYTSVYCTALGRTFKLWNF